MSKYGRTAKEKEKKLTAKDVGWILSANACIVSFFSFLAFCQSVSDTHKKTAPWVNDGLDLQNYIAWKHCADVSKAAFSTGTLLTTITAAWILLDSVPLTEEEQKKWEAKKAARQIEREKTKISTDVLYHFEKAMALSSEKERSLYLLAMICFIDNDSSYSQLSRTARLQKFDEFLQAYIQAKQQQLPLEDVVSQFQATQ